MRVGSGQIIQYSPDGERVEDIQNALIDPQFINQENGLVEEEQCEDEQHQNCNCIVDYLPEDMAADKNPRNYGYYPSCYTKRIPQAGKITFRSESVFDVIKS